MSELNLKCIFAFSVSINLSEKILRQIFAFVFVFVVVANVVVVTVVVVLEVMEVLL